MNKPEYKILKIGKSIIDLNTPVVMAILNVTPDSFWAGSRRTTEEDIVFFIENAINDGATILDVGGYSSRPGAQVVSPEEEYTRVSLAVEVIRRRFPETVISLDTFRAEIARKVIQNFGECIINDISAGNLDTEMIDLAADRQVPFIAMHMRATPADMQSYTEYDDVAADVKKFFKNKISQLKKRGVDDIILDPGFGFAKTTEQNYRLMRHMDELLELGYPILSGISRKSMIYKVLGTTPEHSLTGTEVLNWESLKKGASILRVHDVKEAANVIKIYSYYEKYGK